MGVIRSLIEEATSTDTASMSDADLHQDVIEISRAIDILTHRLAELGDEVRRRGAYRHAGYLNATSWLAHTTDLDNATARSLLMLGGTLNDHPDTKRLASQGELSRARIRVLSRAADAHPETYRAHEEMLLDFARNLRMTDFTRAITYWSNCADAERAERDAARQRQRTRLHTALAPDGMLHLAGEFDPESAEIILKALDAAMTPEARRDGSSGELRPAPKRRAEALVQICGQYLASYPGVLGGHRPHVSLIVDLETLYGRQGKRCDLSRSGTITPETALRILCDAEVSRIIVAGDSAPLEMGRAVRTATPAQRRALAVRDGGCVRAGCDRPPEWCDVHHRFHWILGVVPITSRSTRRIR